MIIEGGYFTIERNIQGLTTREIETRLGFRPGRLTHGARVIALAHEPRPDEFEPRGSTRYPDGTGLEKPSLHATKYIPGAWFGQRLVKVEPTLPHSGFEWYPPSPGAAEQWKLMKPVTGYEVCRLSAGETYWGR